MRWHDGRVDAAQIDPNRRWFLWACTSAAVTCLLGPLAAMQGAAQGAAREPGETDEQLLRAFKRQPEKVRREIIESFTLEARHLEGFYFDCLRVALRGEDRDPYAWPEWQPAPFYDPEAHAPGAAARRVLSERSSQVKSARKRFFRGQVAPPLDSAWVYEYGSREIRRKQSLEAPERIFQNALAGFAPDHDRAEALVERALDDGSQAKALGAFAHAYTTRDGAVLTSITLYDALSSGEEIEMPDVDCLGIIHEVRDDWKSFPSPVPANLHAPLYREIAQMFEAARHHRELRLALARVYLRADASLPDGYQPHLGRFHALWASFGSDPAALLPKLPDAEHWQSWLESEGKRVDTDLKLWGDGEARRAALALDAGRVRETLVRVMHEFGALGK